MGRSSPSWDGSPATRSWVFSMRWCGSDGARARSDRATSIDAGRVWENRRHPGTRAQLHGAGYFQRDVERALFLQELAAAVEEAADAGPPGGAGPGRKRGDYRYRRRLRDRVQDRVAQPPQLYRAVSGRG